MGVSTVCGIQKWKDHFLLSFMASRESVKDIFKQMTWQEPKLMQLGKVLTKGFAAVPSRERPVTWLVVIEITEVFL
jgi:hypothetical protein